MPGVPTRLKNDAVMYRRRLTVPYTHFSVCLSRRRRFARFVAWNVHTSRLKVVDSGSFRLDDRVRSEYQVDNRLYRDNPLDRGHIAMRKEVAWGSEKEAQQASDDSYCYTNIAPQHEQFNQSRQGGTWGELEEHIGTQSNGRRLSVLGGPVFGTDDPEYRGVRIPQEYWKLVAYRARDNSLTSASFILSQKELLGRLLHEMDFGDFHLYQQPLTKLKRRTGLNFDAYDGSDVMEDSDRISVGRDVRPLAERVQREGREIYSLDDVIF